MTVLEEHKLVHSSNLQDCIHSPRPLGELETVWLDHFHKLRTDERLAKRDCKLAAPFLSVPLPGYRPGNPETIMLVGKATSGCNTIGSADIKDRYDLDEVKKRTLAVIDDQLSRRYQSPFLNFAEHLSVMGIRYAQGQLKPFENLIWSNLAKIGTKTGNPGGSLLPNEECLIAETLAAEIYMYRPRLVCFATGWYRFGLVRKILYALSDNDGKDDMFSKKIWSCKGTSNRFAYLWTMHPERKTAATLNDWINAAEMLLRS